MTWVRRRPARPVHECDLPMLQVNFSVPSMAPGSGGEPMEWTEPRPDGHRGDLWRCPECRRLWRIGDGCRLDNEYGPHPGPCGFSLRQDAWRPARWWQRLAHISRGRTEESTS